MNPAQVQSLIHNFSNEASKFNAKARHIRTRDAGCVGGSTQKIILEFRVKCSQEDYHKFLDHIEEDLHDQIAGMTLVAVDNMSYQDENPDPSQGFDLRFWADVDY
jgi:hypothetical protein